MDAVDCKECGFRYDSDDNAFCPRCGSEHSGPSPDATIRSVARSDPARRRVQAGGIVLVVIGLLSTVLYASVAISAGDLVPQFSEELLADEPGGDVLVRLLGPDGPVAGATVTAATFNGTVFANATTDTDGEALLSLRDHAAANVTVTAGDQTWSRKVLALQGTTTTVGVSQDDPATRDAWTGIGSLVSAMRGLLVFFIAMSLFVAVAGVMALRLRQKNVAVAGGIVGALPALILVVALPNLGSLLFLVLMVGAAAFVWAGRAQFR